jgi:hypothetical protein
MTFSQADFAVIAALDLDPIKVKLMHEESGEGWSLEQATAVEFEYRRFLYLMKKFPEEGAAPRVDVDIFWHYHILDTIKYAHDCQAVFGYFLHHFPYIGLRGAEDLEAHQRVGERMRELYEGTFGEPFMQGAVAPKTAFSTRVSATAFSTRVSATAFSTRVSATAFSTRVSTTAFSTRVSPTAFSTAPAGTALSTATGPTAFSTAPLSTASSTATISPALSNATIATGAHAAPGRADESWSPQAAGFFTLRPALPSAGVQR